jgi:hypothetical protein
MLACVENFSALRGSNICKIQTLYSAKTGVIMKRIFKNLAIAAVNTLLF